MNVELYTDGACWPNPGPGGWAVVVPGRVEFGGREEQTTNNRMELAGLIGGLRWFYTQKLCGVIWSDAEYAVKGYEKWLAKWILRGWKKDTVKNRDQWEEIAWLRERVNVRARWVRGHDGNRWNERADVIAEGLVRGEDIPGVVRVVRGENTGFLNWGALKRIRTLTQAQLNLMPVAGGGRSL